MIELPPLPYPETALEPHMSAKTLSFHYGKHHKTYVETTNKLIKGTEFENLSLDEIVKRSAKNRQSQDGKKLFNNAAQVWNHNFFWQSLKPEGGGMPGGSLLKQIETDFESFEEFQADFEKQGTEVFGTGWVWLVQDGGKLEILATEDADTPLAHGVTALICADVWEHAYYLDYQNRRPDFLKIFLKNLINWDFAAHNFSAKSAKAA